MSIARSVATVGGATLVSRVLGFARDAGIAAILGAGIFSDAFYAALQIPNLFRRLLAEGALNAAFVPLWLRLRGRNGTKQSRLFGEEALGLVFAATALLAFLCIAFAPLVVRLIAPGFETGSARHDLAVTFLRIAISYIAIAGLVAVAAAILNAERRVAAVAYGVVVFNIVLIAAVIALFLLKNVEDANAGKILSAAFVLGGGAQLLVVGIALWNATSHPLWPRFTFSQNTRNFFTRIGPGLIAGGVPQLALIAGAMIASLSPAALSWLYYAYRLYELPLGVLSSVIASVMAPAIAASLRSGKFSGIASAQSRAIEIAAALALPAALAFVVLSTPIVRALFERGAFEAKDTQAVAAILSAIAAGLPGHILEKIFAAVSFSHEDTHTPMGAALIGLAVAVIGGWILFPVYGAPGIAAAIALSGWIGAVGLGCVLARRRWLRFDRMTVSRLPRIVLATAAMGLVVFVMRDFLATSPAIQATAWGRIAGLAILVVSGLGFYLLSLQALRVGRVQDILTAIRKPL